MRHSLALLPYGSIPLFLIFEYSFLEFSSTPQEAPPLLGCLYWLLQIEELTMPGEAPPLFQLVLSTCGTETEAHQIAKHLVAERLAACAQVVPGLTSYYHWEGKMEQSTETLLLLKTSATTLETLLEILPTLHSYEVPEAVVIPITGGYIPYLNWLQQETNASD